MGYEIARDIERVSKHIDKLRIPSETEDFLIDAEERQEELRKEYFNEPTESRRLMLEELMEVNTTLRLQAQDEKERRIKLLTRLEKRLIFLNQRKS